MKVLVNVDRETAIKAGSEVYGQVIVDLALADLTEEDRAVVAGATEHNGITDLTALPWIYQPAKPKTAVPEPLAWIAWRREAIAARDQWIVDTRVKIAEDLALYLEWAREQPVSAFIRWDHRQGGVPSLPSSAEGPKLPTYPHDLPWYPGRTDPQATAWAALADQLAAARAEIDRRQAFHQEREAAREAENAEAARQRRERLAAEVPNMDANAQGRWKLGLLPEEEILDSLRNRLFASLDGWPRYVKITGRDLPHEDWCDSQEITCTAGPADALTAAQYERFDLLARDLPAGARYDIKVHVCTCQACGAETSRYSVRVKIEDGPLVFTREYALEPLNGHQATA